MSEKRGTHNASRRADMVTMAMLALAFLFPIGLMIGNPTLMFERGWEQYVGTGIYFWAVVTLILELRFLRTNDKAFDQAPGWLKSTKLGATIAADDSRLLAARIRHLTRHAESDTAKPSMDQFMQLNQEASGLDQEQASGRFTLTKYILYLLPVIGFIGTVEGISKALMNISRVLPMVKDLDGFLSNLTSVTSALQIAFDSTLLALFLSAALMLAQTLVHRRAEELLARIDRFIDEEVLPRLGSLQTIEKGSFADLAATLDSRFQALEAALLGQAETTRAAIEGLTGRLGDGLGMGPYIERFAESIGPLPEAFASFRRGAETFGGLGDELRELAESGEATRRSAASLGRIESALTANAGPDEQLTEIQRGIDRTCAAIESLSTAWAQSLEKSSRATQEQLARTLSSLKDALDLLQVSIEQGNSLYRNIVKKMFDDRSFGGDGVKAA